MNNFADNLKFLLKRFGVKQSDIALAVKKKQTTISNWINRVSEPDVSQLLDIHQYFGISLDALVKSDLAQENVVTDEHVAEFKKLGSSAREVPKKPRPVSKQYFINEEPQRSMLSEPEAVTSWAVMGQLKHIHEKLDNIQDSVDSIAHQKQ